MKIAIAFIIIQIMFAILIVHTLINQKFDAWIYGYALMCVIIETIVDALKVAKEIRRRK